jgi:hypothetical protein
MGRLYAMLQAYTAYYLHRFTCHDKTHHFHQWGRVSIEHVPPPGVR